MSAEPRPSPVAGWTASARAWPSPTRSSSPTAFGGPFGGLVAVDVDHVEVQRGEITALIGPNGAGKTTFFNLLTGFDEPDQGHWTFDGTSIEGHAALQGGPARHGAHVPADQGLARLTVIENMRLGADRPARRAALSRRPAKPLWRRQERDITERADALLERFTLDHMRDEFAGNLSGGQRKLLEMARALMADPKLIMLDEPMAGVNPALKQSLLEHIKSLRDEGRTVLFVEHDMDMVHEISDWVLVMAQGRLIAEGTAAADLGRPGRDRRLPGRPPRRRPRRDGRGRRRCRRWASTPRHSASAAFGATARRGSRSTWNEQRRRRPPNVIDATDLVAGYVPEVNILNGCNLVVGAGRVRRDHRSQRRRQVDVPQGGARPGPRALRDRAAARRGHHRARPPTSSSQRGVGFVPQTNNVFQTLTVRENLRDGLLPRRRSASATATTSSPACSRGSRERADQQAGSLSGGERQMVAMGRALMLDPSLAAARRALGRAVADAPGRGVPALQADQRHRRGDPDGGAERPPVPAGVPPRLRARPGSQRLHGVGPRAARPTRR